MKLRILTAGILAATLSTVGLAQAAGTGATATTSGNANAAASQSGTDMTKNYGQIIADLKNGSEQPSQWSSELQGLKPDADVQIVKLSELKGQAGENGQALDQAVKGASSDLASAQTAIQGKPELAQALQAQNFTAQDVVAVMVESDSQVTLVVDDKA